MREDIKAKLEEWEQQGWLTENNRNQILQYESRKTTEHTEGGSRSGEVLAYIGGLIILSGMYALLDDFWDEMSLLLRQAVLTMLTLTLLGVGHRLLGQKARAIQRLGGFLSTIAVLGLFAAVYYGTAEVLNVQDEISWVVSLFSVTVVSFLIARRLLRMKEPFVQASGVVLQYTMAASGYLGIFVLLSAVLEWNDNISLLTSSIVCAVVSASAWIVKPSSTIHAITYAYVLFGVMSGMDYFLTDASSMVYGLVIWGTALVWFGGCAFNRLHPASAGILISSILLPMSSSVVLSDQDLIGSALLLISGVVLITFSTFQFQMRVFTVGALSVLVASPTLMYQLFEDILPTSVLLILSGMVLLGGGLLLNRIRQTLVDAKAE